jgi:hypothetical protein
MSFAAKICLVTGANKGIGLELVRQLSASGASVYATCRQSSLELDAIDLNGGAVVENIGMLRILYILSMHTLLCTIPWVLIRDDFRICYNRRLSRCLCFKASRSSQSVKF